MSQGKVNNESYQATLQVGASALKQLMWFIVNGVFFINPLNPLSGLKVFLLRLFGARIGNGVVIKPSVNIKFPWKLAIGNHAWIGEKVWIDNLVEVKIGNHVCISQGALLLTGTHDYSKSTFNFIANTILLEDGVWIGAKSVVTGGVICYSHSILGSNSIAESNLKPYVIYKGNPAVAVLERNISLVN